LHFIHRIREDALDNVALLSGLSRVEKVKVAEALDAKVYKDGDVIIKEGDPGDGMFFVTSGSASPSCHLPRQTATHHCGRFT
jgi:cAMP-dependent protein kinase regulator